MQVPALPVTVNPAVEPVLFSNMPLLAPFAEMLRKVRPLAPMVVLTMLRAMPVVDVMTLTELAELLVYVIVWALLKSTALPEAEVTLTSLIVMTLPAPMPLPLLRPCVDPALTSMLRP